MASWQLKEFDIREINGGNRYENGKPVSAESVNAAIEASYRTQEVVKTIGQTHSVFGEVGYDSSVPIYAYMQYTRLSEKQGIFKLTCNIPSKNGSSSFGAFSTSKINALFSSNHSIEFSANGNKGFAFLSNYNAESSQNIIGYAPLCEWSGDNISIGRIHNTSGTYGAWSLSTFSGAFHTEISVNEV